MRMRAWYLVPALLALAACSASQFEPPERSGPAALVDAGAGKQAWLATTQEEERSRRVGRGASGRWVTESIYHLRLQAHDPANAQRLWLKELKAVPDKEGGRSAQIRILGQQGDVVWTWVHDQALALSARDASVVADRAKIEQANPDLAGLLPRELKFYTWMGELVVTLADARRVRIVPPAFRAEPYAVANEEQFRYAGGMTHTWNGDSATQEFGVRHGRFGGEWIGLLSEAEARDGESDGYGDHYADSAEIADEREMARRTFWRATSGFNTEYRKQGREGICESLAGRAAESAASKAFFEDKDKYFENVMRNDGKYRDEDADARARDAQRACLDAFDEERYKRIVKLERIPGAGEWLQGRLLKASATPGAPQWVQRGIVMKPAVRPPLRLADSDGVLVLHRTRMDAQGRLALSRVDGTFARTLWTAVLPYAELTGRWETGSHLLLHGNWSEERAGVTRRHEALVSLDLASGRWQGWDLGGDAALETTASN